MIFVNSTKAIPHIIHGQYERKAGICNPARCYQYPMVYRWILAAESRRNGVFSCAKTEKEDERDRLCRLAVRAGHRDACRMFCCLHPDLFKEQPPLKPFKLHGTKVVFYGQYYPSRYKPFLNDDQQAFCHSVYEFKEGKYTALSFSNLA